MWGVNGSNINRQGIQRDYVAPGEQVCAVQYRMVCFKWVSSHSLDKAFLEKGTCWKMYSGIRTHGIEANDVVEIDLDDDLKLDNNCEEHQSDKYGKFVL